MRGNKQTLSRLQENCSSQGFEEPMDEYVREKFNGNLEQVLKNDEKEQRFVSNHEEKLGLTEQKQSFIYVQESTTKVHIVAEIMNDTLQVLNLKFQRKALV